jgi:hypothetical protein
MIFRAAVLILVLIALIGIGLYVVPYVEENSGVVASSGSEFAIHVGNWETIPFSVNHNGSRLSGSFETSQNISVYISASSPYDKELYILTNATAFTLNASLSKGNYYLVFVAVGSLPIYIFVKNSIVVN